MRNKHVVGLVILLLVAMPVALLAQQISSLTETTSPDTDWELAVADAGVATYRVDLADLFAKGLAQTLASASTVGHQIEAASGQTANLFELNSNGGNGGDLLALDASGYVDLQGASRIIWDADADTFSYASADDTISTYIGGVIGLTLDSNKDAAFRGSITSFDDGKSSELHPNTGLAMWRGAAICWTDGSDYYSTDAVCESTPVVSTTDATLTILDSFSVASDTTITIECEITARRTDADDESAAYQLTVLADNNAGTTAVVGTDAGYVIEDTAAWAVSASADDTNDEIDIEVTGEASKSITWRGKCSYNLVTG